MNDPTQSPEAASWIVAILYKFLPAAFGAALMIVIEPPKTRKELFWRLVAAFICSAIFGELAMDWLHSISWFAFLDPFKRSHQAAIDFIVGGSGWFILGGGGVMLRRFKGDPVATAEEAKKALP